MYRKLSSLLLLSLFTQSSFANSVDENKARTIGYNFCKSQGAAVALSELRLAYTAVSPVNGEATSDFFVFNTGAKGFVIVAADDNVVPVLAYSDESSFDAAYIPENISYWLNGYKAQIGQVIAQHQQASPSVVRQWADLSQQPQAQGLSRTTNDVVLPLMKTYWNQEPNYNYLCPYDASAQKNVLTGCVATAMAQVMKYWNWPRRGVGSHTYNDGSYGMLSADFGTTVYQWDSMPNGVGVDNQAVGTLMYQAGVSVNMSYGPTSSGAYVIEAMSPVTNCTQYALPNYFSYKASLEGLVKAAYSDSDWVHILKAELDAKRPIIYSGFGSAGGHCFVTDGYITYSRFHFNWGWGGYGNGYYIVENLAPGNDDFNQNQSIIIGIEPDSTIIAGVKDIAMTGEAAVYPNPVTGDHITVDLAGSNATAITLTDALGRQVSTVAVAPGAATRSISVAGLVNGIYTVAVQAAAGTKTSKIVVSR